MKRFKIWVGQKLCDFGLYVLSLGPKDQVDREYERKFIQLWREFQAKKSAKV